LYNRSKALGPTVVDKKSPSCGENESVEGRKKQPGSVHKQWGLKKFFSLISEII
jgi:hypothetical protein